jgi:DNA modification methylase
MSISVKDQDFGPNWAAYNGDCIEVMQGIPDRSIGFSIFSPPYSSLYTYSASDRDIGNCRGDEEFFEHFQFVIKQLRRVMMPGRIVAVDCMDIPSMKERDGVIGLKDFPGDVVRAFQAEGFIYHSRHCIWKDPLIEATRTKALGLMHKQICKDSTMCRSGLPQYLLAFRCPGENPVPVAHPKGIESFAGEDGPTKGNLSHERWRRYASPVWMDIRPSHTLNTIGARDEKDEKHVCPMALDIIERGLELWSTVGDTVLSPFMGIGSEGFQAIKMGRRFVGAELKASYWGQACRNLRSAESAQHGGLFDDEVAG